MITKAEFDNYIEQIENCINFYKTFDKRKFTNQIQLSDGTNLSFAILEKHLAHLLGVNTEFLKSYNLCHGNNSYQILTDLIANSYSVFNKLKQGTGKISKTQIFSSQIDRKLEIFKENILINFFSLMAVTEFDSEKIYMSGIESDLVKANYFLISESKNTDYQYLVLALAKDEQNKNYGPISSMGFKKEEFDDFGKTYLKKQNCYIPFETRITTKDGLSKKLWLNYANQHDKLQFLKELKTKYQASICVEKNLEYQLQQHQTQDNERQEIRKILNLFIQNILQGKSIEIPEVDLDYLTFSLFTALKEAYNEELFQKTPISEEDKNYKLELEKLTMKSQMLESQNEEYQEEQIRLKMSLDDVTEKYQKLKSVYIDQQEKLTKIKELLAGEEQTLKQ